MAVWSRDIQFSLVTHAQSNVSLIVQVKILRNGSTESPVRVTRSVAPRFVNITGIALFARSACWCKDARNNWGLAGLLTAHLSRDCWTRLWETYSVVQKGLPLPEMALILCVSVSCWECLCEVVAMTICPPLFSQSDTSRSTFMTVAPFNAVAASRVHGFLTSLPTDVKIRVKFWPYWLDYLSPLLIISPTKVPGERSEQVVTGISGRRTTVLIVLEDQGKTTHWKRLMYGAKENTINSSDNVNGQITNAHFVTF
jgi:hypothetical protein